MSGAELELDEISVTGLEVFAHHGVLAAERRDGQRFVVDLVLWLDTRCAAHSDDLRDTVDYGSLVADVERAVREDPADLIETVAERVAGVVLVNELVRRVRVVLHKPEAPVPATVADVALTITRTASANRSRP